MSSSKELPAIGLGTVGIGGLYAAVSADDAQTLLRAAWTNGIRYFDTAPMYGLGISERRLAHFIDSLEAPTELLISTKVGRLLVPGTENQGDFPWGNSSSFSPRYDYSYEGILRSVEDSQQRLGVDHFDIVHIHDIGVATHGDDNRRYLDQLRRGGYEALEQLRRDKVVDKVGVGVNETDAVLTVLDDFRLDSALLAGRFTLLEQPDEEFFRRCADARVELIAGGIYNSGALVGDGHYEYGTAPAAVRARVALLSELCDRFSTPLYVAATQFVARQPQFRSVLIGPRTVSELQQNLLAMDAHIPDGLWEELTVSAGISPVWTDSLLTSGARS